MTSIKIHRLKRKRMSSKVFKAEIESQKYPDKGLTDYSLTKLKSEVESAFGNTVDLKIIEGRIGHTEGLLFYLETMVDGKTLKETTREYF